MVDALTESIMDGARAELDQVLAMGGVVAAVESGYLKSALVASLAERRRRLESGDEVVVGVNRYAETEPSPLTAAGAAPVEQVDPEVEAHAIADVQAWRDGRDAGRRRGGADGAARGGRGTDANLMPSTLECVRAGSPPASGPACCATVFGEYRAPTGPVRPAVARPTPPVRRWPRVRERVRATAAELGAGRLRLLVGKPGLDGHSNGAEQIAVRARDAGFEVIYQGIRLTPAEIVAAAVEEGVDLVGLSVLSGSHLRAVPDVLDGLRRPGWTSRSWSAASSRPRTSGRCWPPGWPGSSPRRTSRSPTSSTVWSRVVRSANHLPA